MTQTAFAAAPANLIRFRMGDDVPDWLIVANPVSPNSHMDVHRFATDVDVFETDAYYLVFPSSPSSHVPYLFDSGSSLGLEFTAATRPVYIVTQRGCIHQSVAHAQAAIRLFGWGRGDGHSPPTPAPLQPQVRVRRPFWRWAVDLFSSPR